MWCSGAALRAIVGSSDVRHWSTFHKAGVLDRQVGITAGLIHCITDRRTGRQLSLKHPGDTSL